MIKFNKIAIIGVGLIGGSIGLAAKKRKVCRKVIGVFRHRATLQRALRAKAIDAGFMNIKDGVKDADIIILASPVSSIPALGREAIRYAKKGAIITDAGSTKQWIVGELEKAPQLKQGAFFVGAHPMAGSEHIGVEFSRPDLFVDSWCIVTKTKNTDGPAVKRVAEFWKALGAKVEIMDPATHDKTVSLISHLPHLVAFGLAGSVPGRAIRYSAEGFKDTTRVASSDPQLWADIFVSNKSEVLASARLFGRFFDRLTTALSRNEYSRLVKMLGEAKAKRDKFIDG